MKTFLLIWNPKKWAKWESLAAEALKSAAGERIADRWSFSAHIKTVQIGDRVFLIRLGERPKGIIASGWVTDAPRLGEHWDKKKAAIGKEVFYVECEWERLLNPEIDAPLDLAQLKSGVTAKMDWTPRFSGARIPEETVEALEDKWANHVGKTSLAVVSASTELSAMEGAQRMALVRHYERERWLRDEKMSAARSMGNGNLKCEVPRCGFDFEAVYGDLGHNYAQVHHLQPLSDRTMPGKTSLDDLAVVCANCHVMIHRGGNCRALTNLIPQHLPT